MYNMLIGLAFVFVIEGLLYAVFPGTMRRMALEIQNIPESSLRAVGVGVLATGVAAVWLARYLFGGA